MIDNLPDGYFYPGDILAYRAMVESVPVGGSMVEIGVYRGRSLLSVLPICRERQISITAVDPFYGIEDVYRDFVENVKRADAVEVVNVLRMPSVEAATKFADRSLDLVFIDGPHHYHNVKQDLDTWLPKVKLHGIIAGHDYCPLWPGVAKALQETFGDVGMHANVNETDYCVCWKKQVGLNIVGGAL